VRPPRRVRIIRSVHRYEVAPLYAWCVVLGISSQYLKLRAPDGREVWAARCDGALSAPRGGVPGVQGAPMGARGRTAWGAWRLCPSDLSAVWAESANAEAAAIREDERRERRAGA
jgi:hypothetical protein